MLEAWYIEHDLADGWHQREADYQVWLLEASLAKHAAFDAYYATLGDGGETCNPC